MCKVYGVSLANGTKYTARNFITTFMKIYLPIKMLLGGPTVVGALILLAFI